MTKESKIPKSRKQTLSQVLKQMDRWLELRTRLTFSISTPLFNLVLRGRIIGRQGRLFLFDSYGETCRVPVIPECYERLICNQEDTTSITFRGSSGTAGELRFAEDDRPAGLEEILADWFLSTLSDAADASDPQVQSVPKTPEKCSV
jgi:hypothetical protein